MKAVVYNGLRDVSVSTVPDPEHGRAKPSQIISQRMPLAKAPDAGKHFDDRDTGWTKVVLKPAA